jgi:hypothetical protein
MEVCLPADFYKLRDELPVDWRDAPARDHVNDAMHAWEAREPDAANTCADTDWRVF